MGRLSRRRRVHADHADVPRARVGLAVRGHAAGHQAGLPGPLRRPRRCSQLKQKPKASPSRIACRPSCTWCCTHPAAKDVDMNGWKMVIGGSALPKSLAKAALDRGIDIFCGYGMSETCPLLTLPQLEPDVGRRGNDGCRDRSAHDPGHAVPLVELRIVDPRNERRAARRQVAGEVVVRAPWLTQGYFKNPEASRGAVGGRLAAHQRHRHDRARRLPAASPTASRTSSRPAANGSHRSRSRT